jgi:hypothetical protein
MPDTAPPAGTASPLPIIVDLGKYRRKDVKRLREGQGKLMGEIASCLEELKGAGKLADGVRPVVILVREKRRKAALWPLP